MDFTELMDRPVSVLHLFLRKGLHRHKGNNTMNSQFIITYIGDIWSMKLLYYNDVKYYLDYQKYLMLTSCN